MQRTYTPDEFRDLLTALYEPATDWELARRAAPDFNVKPLTVYLWLQGKHPIVGTAAAAAYLLQQRNEST